MALADVDICNDALRMLDAPALASIDDLTKDGVLCKRAYPGARDVITEMFVWSAALKRVALPALTAVPAFGWNYQYQLPEDCIRALPLRKYGDPGGDLVPFEAEGRLILTDETAPLYLRYLKRMDVVAEITPLFGKAISARLAADIGREVTGKDGYVQIAEARLVNILRDAEAVEILRRNADETICDAWLDARA